MSGEMSILDFVGHLGRATLAYDVHKKHQLEKAAKLVQGEAKHMLGTYQDGAGPFVAWEELAEQTKEERARHGYSENEPLLVKGDLRDSIDYRVGTDEAAVGSDSPIAEYQELGTNHIPPRSFLGIAAVHKGQHVAAILGDAATLALVGEGVFEGRMHIK